MIKEAVGTGTSIDEAKENALLKLGAKPEDDVSIEVLETYKKKSFGLFGGTLAKVRAFMEVPDERKKRKMIKAKNPPIPKKKKPKLKTKTKKIRQTKFLKAKDIWIWKRLRQKVWNILLLPRILLNLKLPII